MAQQAHDASLKKRYIIKEIIHWILQTNRRAHPLIEMWGRIQRIPNELRNYFCTWMMMIAAVGRSSEKAWADQSYVKKINKKIQNNSIGTEWLTKYDVGSGIGQEIAVAIPNSFYVIFASFCWHAFHQNWIKNIEAEKIRYRS